MTNGDKIRQMSDEELAVYLRAAGDGAVCPGDPGYLVKCSDPSTSCYKCWLNWLKQEAKDE